MVIPPGMTEREVLDAIEKAVGILAPSFVFGYYDVDDIKQHGRLAALKVLEKVKGDGSPVYDASRPFENFIYSHVKNRYINLRRDKFRRNDPPCLECHRGEWCGFENAPCEKYHVWKTRNTAKANLMRPVNIGGTSDSPSEGEFLDRPHSNPLGEQDAETAELLRRIDEELPVEFRSAWKQMQDHHPVPKEKRDVIELRIREILKGNLEWPNEED